MMHPALLGAAAQQVGGDVETIIGTLGATYWLDFTALTDDTVQAITPTIGTGNTTRGSDAGGIDTADPAISLTPVPRLVFAGDDYCVMPAAGIPSFTHTSGAYTLVMVAATTSGTTGVLYQSGSTIDNGLSLFVRNGTDQIVARVGSVSRDSVATVNFNDGSVRGIAFVIDDGTFEVYERTIGFGTTQTALAPTHTQGRIGGAATFWNGTVYHVAMFPTALTEGDLEDAIDYLIGLATP